MSRPGERGSRTIRIDHRQNLPRDVEDLGNEKTRLEEDMPQRRRDSCSRFAKREEPGIEVICVKKNRSRPRRPRNKSPETPLIQGKGKREISAGKLPKQKARKLLREFPVGERKKTRRADYATHFFN